MFNTIRKTDYYKLMIYTFNYLISFIHQDSFAANLLRLIQKMRPNKPKKKKKKKKGSQLETEEKTGEIEMKKQLFPGLAMPNNPDVRV